MGLIEWAKALVGGKPKPQYGEVASPQFAYPSAIDEMKQYGFLYLKNTDTMAERKARIRKELNILMEAYLLAENGTRTSKHIFEMKKAINALYNLCQLEIIPYFRAIKNEELLIIAKMFIFKYDINNRSPNAFGKLITYVRYMLGFFTDIDVTIPIPFVIQNAMPTPPGGAYPPNTFSQPKNLEHETQKWGNPKNAGQQNQ